MFSDAGTVFTVARRVVHRCRCTNQIQQIPKYVTVLENNFKSKGRSSSRKQMAQSIYATNGRVCKARNYTLHNLNFTLIYAKVLHSFPV